jgi:ribonuclease D
MDAAKDTIVLGDAGNIVVHVVAKDAGRLERMYDRLRQKSAPSAPPFVAVDVEGIHYFDRDGLGRISLVQLAVQNETSDSVETSYEVLLVDCVSEHRGAYMPALKRILECADTTKIIHDCHVDSDMLWHCLGIKLCNVFDTSAVDSYVNATNKLRSLNVLVRSCGIREDQVNVSRDKIVTRSFYTRNPEYWLTRPLTMDALKMAALDVPCLFGVRTALAERYMERYGKSSPCAHEELVRLSDLNVTYRRDVLVHQKTVTVHEAHRGMVIGRGGANIMALYRMFPQKIYVDASAKGFIVSAPSRLIADKAAARIVSLVG